MPLDGRLGGGGGPGEEATAFPQIRDFHYWAQLPGESVESGSRRIQYIADRMIPEVTRRLSGCTTPQPA